MSKHIDSGIDWIGLIPSHWSIKPLKHLLIERKEINRNLYFTDVLSLTNDRGVIPYSEKGEIGNKARDDVSNYKIVRKNDIVINSMNLYIGSVGLSKYDGVVSPVYYMLHKRNENDSIEYYNQLFQTKELQKKSHGYGNGILEIRMRIPMSNLNRFPLPVPPSEEQHKIMNVLNVKIEKIDRLIQIQEKQIENLKEYKQSLVSSIFANRVHDRIEDGIYREQKYKPIQQLCKIIRGNSPYTKDDLADIGEYVGLQYGKTYKVDIVDSNFGFYVSDKFMKLDQIVIHDDVILISTSETIEDLGHTCYYARNDEGLLGGEQFVLRPNSDKVKGKYLYYLSLVFTKKLKKYHTGLKVYRFNSNHINNIFLDIHNFSEQEKIIIYLDEKFNQINTLIEYTTNKVEKLNEYKKSLIYEYVTGKKEI